MRRLTVMLGRMKVDLVLPVRWGLMSKTTLFIVPVNANGFLLSYQVDDAAVVPADVHPGVSGESDRHRWSIRPFPTGRSRCRASPHRRLPVWVVGGKLHPHSDVTWRDGLIRDLRIYEHAIIEYVWVSLPSLTYSVNPPR